MVNEVETRSIKRLIDTAAWSSNDVKEARKRQRRAYRRLGSILVAQGALSQGDLDTAIERMVHRGGTALGEGLIAQGTITRQDLDRALAQQAMTRVLLTQALPLMAAGE